jgi:hypothetical protein
MSKASSRQQLMAKWLRGRSFHTLFWSEVGSFAILVSASNPERTPVFCESYKVFDVSCALLDSEFAVQQL